MQLCNEMQFLYELNELACEEDLVVCNPIKRDTTCTFKEGMYKLRKVWERNKISLFGSYIINITLIVTL